MRSVNHGTVDTCSPWELKKKFLYIFYFMVNSIRNSCVCILLASYTRESHAYNIIIWLVKSYDFSSSTLENVNNIIFFVFNLRTSVLFIIYYLFFLYWIFSGLVQDCTIFERISVVSSVVHGKTYISLGRCEISWLLYFTDCSTTLSMFFLS